MTRDQLTEIAREVYGSHVEWHGVSLARLETLAHRYMAVEREACIDIVELCGGSVEIEAAIRARGYS